MLFSHSAFDLRMGVANAWIAWYCQTVKLNQASTIFYTIWAVVYLTGPIFALMRLYYQITGRGSLLARRNLTIIALTICIPELLWLLFEEYRIYALKH